MEKYTYLIINFFIIIGPLLFTFNRLVNYKNKLRYVFTSILVVATIYILWDVLATAAGHWAFSEIYTSGFRLLGLPIEEILFFITVPYSCLFVYEVINRFLTDREFQINDNYLYVAALLLSAIAFLFLSGYTLVVVLSTAIVLVAHKVLGVNTFLKKNFWVFMIISYGLFIGTNYFLTSIPVVTYGAEFNLGIRITTIPLEDFIYNFSMLGAYAMIFDKVKSSD